MSFYKSPILLGPNAKSAIHWIIILYKEMMAVHETFAEPTYTRGTVALPNPLVGYMTKESTLEMLEIMKVYLTCPPIPHDARMSSSIFP